MTRWRAGAAAVAGFAVVVGAMAWGMPRDTGMPCRTPPPSSVGLLQPSSVALLALGASDGCARGPGSGPARRQPVTHPTAAPTSAPARTPAPVGRPDLSGVGVPPGVKLVTWTRPLTFTANNVTLSGIDFHGAPRITGSNITLTSCRFTSFTFYGPGPLTLKHCDGAGNLNIDAYYRDITGVVIDAVDLRVGAHDGFDLFSSAHGRISNVTVIGSIVSGMTFPAGSKAHGDAMQVRGITHLRVLDTVLDCGPYQHQKNSAFYLENVHGGLNDILIADSWLAGGGYTFYSNFVSSGVARNVHIDRVGHWGARRTKGGWTFVNVTGPDGEPISP